MINSVIVAVKEKSEKLETSFRAMYGTVPIIQIDNKEAEGICSKYNLGIAQAPQTDGWIIFAHDDAILRAGNPAEELNKMEKIGADIVGVAGTCKIPHLSPGYWWSGITEAGFRGAGAVIHRTPGLEDVFHIESYGPYPQQVAALDGIWIAVKSTLLKKDKNLRFEGSFPGYHYYDADFCATARSRGYKIWVANLLFLHNKWGKGVEDPSFKQHQKLFMDKWKSQMHLYYLNQPKLSDNSFVNSTGAMK
jgi:hypothetical protein